MSWQDYYCLFEKYDGDLSEASKEELDYARRGNPNTPTEALELAQREWARKCVCRAATMFGFQVEGTPTKKEQLRVPTGWN